MPIKISPVMTTVITSPYITPTVIAGYHGTDGNDTHYGASGNDYMYGNDGNDYMFGGAGNDHLYGGAGNDHLVGGMGDDYIAGGSGNDGLYGSEGNDTLVGGTGKDILVGGDGADTFVFKMGDSGVTTATADVIKDLGMWDRIDVSDVVANGHTAVVQNTQITSIEQASALTNYFVALDGHSDTHAILYANASTNTSYLLMDMDGNGSFETGVVLEGVGHPADTLLDWALS